MSMTTDSTTPSNGKTSAEPQKEKNDIDSSKISVVAAADKVQIKSD